MSLPVNIEDLLRRNKVESNRVEFKKGWNPASIYHTICAFANELRDMASRVPFDGRGNPDIKEDDIDYVLIREYLQTVKSRMVGELKQLDTMDLLERMDLLTGPVEHRYIKNVAAMMFSNHPEKFFPYTQVSVVVFPEGKVRNPNRFSEKTFRGSVPSIIRGAMQYLKDVVIMEYVSKPKDRMQSDRWFNYPYQALEESVVNALYHRDYQEHQEVEITVEPEGVYILSFSGPDRSISNEALKKCESLHSRRNRNNRLGDFLKELDLTEGRCTGIPTIQNELAKNGSPRASIETDEDRSYFLMFIPVHEGCGAEVTMKSVHGYNASASVDKMLEENQPDFAQTLPKDCPKILELIAQNPHITIGQLSEKLSLSERTVKNRLTVLKKEGLITRVGSRTAGYWKIIKSQTCAL